MKNWISPDWPAPKNIKACVTTREGGVSEPPYHFFNLGFHVRDDANAVATHRKQLREALLLKNEPQWLQQVHGNCVVEADLSGRVPEADGCFSTQKDLPCAVLTADCLPVLFCNEAGDWVAATHGGWRGLVGGILGETVNAFYGKPSQLMAWMGPAISIKHFEVGVDVRDAVLNLNPTWIDVFQKSDEPNKWYADLYLLARHQLLELGVERVFGGEYCTYSQSDKFYSYRRDGVTGRQASLVWIK
jgi:polyphenol oxidase